MNPNLNIKSVCIVTQLYYPNNQAIAVRMKYVADAFNRKGIDVTILTSVDPAYVDSDFKLINLISPVGSNKDGAIMRLLKEVITAKEVFFRLLFKSSDLFVITSPPFIVSLAAVAACKFKRANYVFDVRDEYPEVYFAQGLIEHNSIPGRILQRLEKWAYNSSVQTLTVTDRIVEKIKSRINDSDKVYLMRNGFTEQIKPLEKLSLDPFNIVFHGNMGKFLNPELIVDVARRCLTRNIGVNFYVYGWGVKTQVILDALESTPNLKHMGAIDHSEIPDLLKSTTLGIAFQGDTDLSKNAFPVKIAEYLGAGIPVIVTPFGEVGKFVVDRKVGLQFENDQAEKIVDAIELFYRNPEELLKLNENTKSLSTQLSRRVISDAFVDQLAIH